MKTVIEMARDAGFPERRAFSDLSDLYPRLKRFAELVAAAEREAIIDLVAMYGGPVDLEAAIRARSKNENSN